MKLLGGVAVVLAAFMALAPVATRADDAGTPANTLTLVIGGAAYDGSPDFAVSFDGKPLGEARLRQQSTARRGVSRMPRTRPNMCRTSNSKSPTTCSRRMAR